MKRLTFGCVVLALLAFLGRATVTNEKQLTRAAQWAQSQLDPWKARAAEGIGQAWFEGEEFAARVSDRITHGWTAVKSRCFGNDNPQQMRGSDFRTQSLMHSVEEDFEPLDRDSDRAG